MANVLCFSADLECAVSNSGPLPVDGAKKPLDLPSLHVAVTSPRHGETKVPSPPFHLAGEGTATRRLGKRLALARKSPRKTDFESFACLIFHSVVSVVAFVLQNNLQKLCTL